MKTRLITGVLSLACYLIVSCCVLTFSSCKRKGNSQENTNAQESPIATTPPFATREPPRYRAIRTITSIVSGTDKPRTTTTLIARDGARRREEYDSSNGEKIVYLTTPAGSYILIPSAKILAALDPAAGAETKPEALDTELSADRLLNEIAVETRYQKLGSETVNGRSATKYRVTTSQTKGTSPVAETLIWVDDALEMPIRWETRRMADEAQTETRMELTEINLDADASAFELPKDYRKVDIPEILSFIHGHKQEMPKTVRN